MGEGSFWVSVLAVLAIVSIVCAGLLADLHWFATSLACVVVAVGAVLASLEAYHDR